MISPPASFYAHWRVQSGVVPLLHDDGESPLENLLQAIWQHQRLRREQLSTLDGVPVRILHPGFQSVEGGPAERTDPRIGGQGALIELAELSHETISQQEGQVNIWHGANARVS